MRDRRGHVRLLAWSILYGGDASTWLQEKVAPDKVEDACSPVSTSAAAGSARPTTTAWQVGCP